MTTLIQQPAVAETTHSKSQPAALLSATVSSEPSVPIYEEVL